MPLKLLQVFSWVQRWPDGAEDKEGALTGTLMKCQERIAAITWMWGCFMAAQALSFDTDRCDLPTAPRQDDCRCFRPHPYNICCIVCSSYIPCFIQPEGKWFVSLNGISTLVTFRQPWHNCAINVTDSFAGSSWLVLNHNCITARTEDITCLQFNGMLLMLFVCVMMMMIVGKQHMIKE